MTNTLITSQDISSKVDGTNGSLENGPVVWMIQNILQDDYHAIIVQENVYLSTALYLIYWYHRTRNNISKQTEMKQNISAYFGDQHMDNIQKLLDSDEIKKIAFEHVEWNVLITPTVDIVIQKDDAILALERDFFPRWPALIWWFIRDEDEDNDLGIDAHIFAALRVAGEKVIWWDVIYASEEDKYIVSNTDKTIQIKLSYNDLRWYSYKDKVSRIVQPSDPRHMVDTTAFKMEIQWDIQDDHLHWIERDAVMNLENDKWGFAFGHHRQIVAELTKEKNEINKAEIDHHHWIRSIVHNPVESYKNIKNRFEANDNHPETPCPELLPIITKMIDDLYSEEINTLCAKNEFVLGQRYLVENSLKHTISDTNKICPYRSTIRSIIDCIKFFDILVRMRENAYVWWKSDTFNTPDPHKHEYAYFFHHKYKNHLDEILAKFPDEILIPTYESFSADDMIEVRAIPLRFVGLSNDLLYVDEFWQTPIEFLGHDGDHSIRMAYEDERYCRENDISRDEYMEISNTFKDDYFKRIQINKEDTQEQKEIKKLKRVILFEITHEDSKPFMRDVIIQSLLTQEGFDIHRESIKTDPKTGYLTRETTVEMQWGISPLAFLLHKLQHGFFDQVDNQNIKVVSPEYRKAQYIAQAAHEILIDLDFTSLPGLDASLVSEISYEWLLQRTCSKSPYKIHNRDFQDPSTQTYGDGTRVDV